jgi:RNA polymerase sigma-70 factor (family 1)
LPQQSIFLNIKSVAFGIVNYLSLLDSSNKAMLQPTAQIKDEKKLAALIAEGNKEAFEELFNAHYKGLYILATKYLKDESLAQDAIQEVFCKLWTSRASINTELSIRSYLFTIAKNHILNVLRNNSSAAKRIIEYTQVNARHQEDSDDGVALSELSVNVYKIIDSLPKKRRIIAKLKLYKGLDNQKIAAKLHLSVNTVKFHYSLALKQIRKII